ncbi:hypothetical protein SDJN03_30293, partial [Cucurbita argyrosperma subsp. sororia]
MVEKVSAVSCNGFLQLLLFIFLFFLLVTATGSSGGRRLIEGTSRTEENPLVENHDGVLGNDLVTMHYTSAKSNRPVHN